MHDDVAELCAEDEIVLILAHDGIMIGTAADEIGKVEIAFAAVERAQAGIDDVIGGDELHGIVLRHTGASSAALYGGLKMSIAHL